MPCPGPGALPRRGVDAGEPTADGLPPLEEAVLDWRVASTEAAKREPEIRAHNPEVVAVFAGPGYGWAWVGQNGGRYAIVAVDDYAIIVVLNHLADCGGFVGVETDGVPVFLVAVP